MRKRTQHVNSNNTSTNFQKNLIRRAWLDQIKYKKPRIMVEEWLYERHIDQQSDIWVYPEYPNKWIAVVIAWDRVWIFAYDALVNRQMYILDIQPIRGFKLNGSIIFELNGAL